ncbi:MAG TPA: DUF1638 domain-containing protein [Dehalococcoidales bacterium]|nr:DUF1638 domain-containing protein [Dehalococcoidales bacterium]
MSQNHEENDIARIFVIACATVIEEMLPLMPPGMNYQKLEFGLHTNPDKLRASLQTAIANTSPQFTTILLGYGLCSRAVTGLKSDRQTLIIPKVDDCIGIFLGSDAEYRKQHCLEPGTLYQTKGWIEADNPLKGLSDFTKKYGEKRAVWLFKQMIKNYTRLAFIITGNYETEHYRSVSRTAAGTLGLEYTEIQGSNRLAKKLLFGPWDDEFVVVPPRQTIQFMDFRSS